MIQLAKSSWKKGLEVGCVGQVLLEESVPSCSVICRSVRVEAGWINVNDVVLNFEEHLESGSCPMVF